ncbi:hypothetical protein Dsin_008307 [Dipteronia sinensis]|uniref:Uncharacterized protein n=1 Tax=Dipteronia sinensis TaxID=43782 RepID=A0AAE0ANQ3_9ROSI|nr:hypothetical protein Dsin_008307 [Dipteronia sinensis]
MLEGNQPSDDTNNHDVEAYRKMRILKLIQNHNDLICQLDDEKERGKMLKEMTKGKTSQGWWEYPTDDLNAEQLTQMDAAFEKLSKTTHSKLNQKNIEVGWASSSSFPAMNPPPNRDLAFHGHC